MNRSYVCKYQSPQKSRQYIYLHVLMYCDDSIFSTLGYGTDYCAVQGGSNLFEIFTEVCA